MRAMNGAAAMVSGTIVAVGPMVVPVINRVTGMTVNSRIKNGTERSALMIVPRMRLTAAFGRIPSASVTTRTSPSGRPSTYETAAATSVIYSVSNRPSPIRMNISVVNMAQRSSS